MSTVQRSDELYELLAQAGAQMRRAAGEVIFEQGEEAGNMFIVLAGSVALKNGDRLVETVAAPGMFGEMALIENEPRSLTAVADTDVQLAAIPAPRFWVLVHQTPHFARLVMSVMAKRLRERGAELG